MTTSHIVVSFMSGGKLIAAFSLRPKSSFNTIKLIKKLLSNDLIWLVSIPIIRDQHLW